MTLNDFADWLHKNPRDWQEVKDPLNQREAQLPVAGLELPVIYTEFLALYGPIALFDDTVVFIGREEIAAVTDFMRSLNQPEQDIYFDHLIPFCDRLANQWYYCFDGEKIVEFDPLDPFSIENVVANSFEEFLDRLVSGKGHVIHLEPNA